MRAEYQAMLLALSLSVMFAFWSFGSKYATQLSMPIDYASSFFVDESLYVYLSQNNFERTDEHPWNASLILQAVREKKKLFMSINASNAINASNNIEASNNINASNNIEAFNNINASNNATNYTYVVDDFFIHTSSNATPRWVEHP